MDRLDSVEQPLEETYHTWSWVSTGFFFLENNFSEL